MKCKRYEHECPPYEKGYCDTDCELYGLYLTAYADGRIDGIDESIATVKRYFCKAIDNGADVFSKEDKDMLTYNKHICKDLEKLKSEKQ